MWLPRPLLRALDPAGAAAVDRVADAVSRADWSGIAWLIDRGTVHETVVVDGRPARLIVQASWDMEPWRSDTWVRVSLAARVAGRTALFRHRAVAQHRGEDLPERAPRPEPVDLALLV